MPFISFSENKYMSIQNEHQLQCEVVSYLKDTDLLFAASMNGYLDSPEKRIKAYQEGCGAGIPDLIIYTPNSTYSGLAIECKSPTGLGKLDKKQSEWLQKLETESNFFTLCSNDYTMIIEVLIKYINNIL
jgi:hypothetical protein